MKLALSSLFTVLPPPSALAAVPENRHVNHVGLTPVVLTESTEALTYCATQGRAFWPASYNAKIPAVNSPSQSKSIISRMKFGNIFPRKLQLIMLENVDTQSQGYFSPLDWCS